MLVCLWLSTPFLANPTGRFEPREPGPSTPKLSAAPVLPEPTGEVLPGPAEKAARGGRGGEDPFVNGLRFDGVLTGESVLVADAPHPEPLAILEPTRVPDPTREPTREPLRRLVTEPRVPEAELVREPKAELGREPAEELVREPAREIFREPVTPLVREPELLRAVLLVFPPPALRST